MSADLILHLLFGLLKQSHELRIQIEKLAQLPQHLPLPQTENILPESFQELPTTVEIK